MLNIKLLFRLFKTNILKNLIIVIQIIISVYVLTFLLGEILLHLETSTLTKTMDLTNKVILAESLHINTLLPGEGRSKKYIEVKKYLQELEGVKSVSNTYTTQLKNQNIISYIYDIPLIYELNFKLKQGEAISEFDINSDTIPILVSETLEDEYPINTSKEFSIYDSTLQNDIKFNIKVVGILKENQYIYIGAPIQGIPQVSDLFIKPDPGEKFIIMPNIFDENASYVVNGGFIVEYDNKDLFFENTYDKVREDGIGKFSKIEELNKNFYRNLIANYDFYIFTFIITYVFILASVGGYNMLETLRYRRLFTIYYINGMNWRKGIFLVVIRNFLLIIVPTILSSIVFNRSLNTSNIYSFNYKTIIITCILYFIVFLLTTIGVIINLKNTNPIEVLKEVD